MKKILFSLIMFLLGTAQMLAATVANLPTTAGSTLQNGYIYRVTSNTTIAAAQGGGSALNVAAGATVTIYIAKGVTLTCKGGGANYATAGGAGISVPSNSTLIITGEGTLDCTGGGAGQGGNGAASGAGRWDTSAKIGYSGSGGYGGCGGGGAGAGIGGAGGNGAPTNTYNNSVSRDLDGHKTGGNGRDTQPGSNGATMGNVYAVSTVTIVARPGGAHPTAGSAGGYSGGNAQYNYGLRKYTAAQGGGGAGGGSGYGAAYGIGGGGQGAQSGASGGAGGITWVAYNIDTNYCYGGQGRVGGVGYRNGGAGTTTPWSNGKASGGAGGGQSGRYASAGGHGNFYAMTTVNRSNAGRTPTTITTPPTAIRTTTTFDLQGAGTNYTQYHYYGIKRDKVAVPVKAGKHFKGYYNAASGGTQYYNEKGEPVIDNGVSNFDANTTLYAQFEEKVTPTADGGMVLQQNTNVTMDDVEYMLKEIQGTDVKNRLDLSKATAIADPDHLVMDVRADKHFSNNTFIYVPEGTTFQHDEHTENVIYKDGSGNISCPNLRVYDGVDMVIPEAFTAANARYDRYGSHRWGTICVPFELESDAIVQFYTSGLISDLGVLVLQKAATVEPGQPAIYQISYIDGTNKDDIYLGEANTPVVTGITPAVSDIKLLGTFQSKSITDEGLYYYSDNSFYLKTQAQPLTVPAFRAYIEMKREEVANAPRRLRIADADNPTAIYELELEAAEDLAGSAAYDLSGRRVGGTHNQGVIIRNGKKIVR